MRVVISIYSKVQYSTIVLIVVDAVDQRLQHDRLVAPVTQRNPVDRCVRRPKKHKDPRNTPSARGTIVIVVGRIIGACLYPTRNHIPDWSFVFCPRLVLVRF